MTGQTGNIRRSINILQHAWIIRGDAHNICGVTLDQTPRTVVPAQFEKLGAQLRAESDGMSAPSTVLHDCDRCTMRHGLRHCSDGGGADVGHVGQRKDPASGAGAGRNTAGDAVPQPMDGFRAVTDFQTLLPQLPRQHVITRPDHSQGPGQPADQIVCGRYRDRTTAGKRMQKLVCPETQSGSASEQHALNHLSRRRCMPPGAGRTAARQLATEHG